MQLPPNLKSIVFDLDGTIIDSVPEVAIALEAALSEFNVEAPKREILNYWSSQGGRQMMAAFFPDDTPEVDQCLARFRQIYLDMPVNKAQAYDSVAEFIQSLSQKGYALGLCTNKPEAHARKILGELKLLPYFSAFCFGDTLTVRKPSPQTLKKVLDGISSLPHEAIMVGDSAIDQETAHSLNLDYWHFSGGYGDIDAAMPAAHEFKNYGDIESCF